MDWKTRERSLRFMIFDRWTVHRPRFTLSDEPGTMTGSATGLEPSEEPAERTVAVINK